MAKEQGQFNLKRWRDMSMSLAETMERIQSGSQAERGGVFATDADIVCRHVSCWVLRSARPTIGRLLAMMDLRRHLARNG